MLNRSISGLGSSLPLFVLLAVSQTEAQTVPQLNAQLSGTNQVQVAWPAGTNFNVLQELPGFSTTNGWQDVPDAPSVLGARYSVLREATNGAAFFRLVNRGVAGASTPSDPATTASALAPNTFNDHGSSTAFLYTGTNAVQIGVASGTIDPVRSSVLRGKVKKRDNSPLPGVRVAILNHPEFGYTYTRTNGMFDLAVNASLYTVDFQAIGYCPAQRQVQAPIQDFRTLKDVVLVALDPAANPVSFGSNAPPQLASGSAQIDDAGPRTARIFFPAGTGATAVMPDGSSQPLGSLTVRITEFTVGTNGPAGMPAPLPATSAYTYCAEFSGDEAMNAGARSIRFDQTAWGYVDNFLGIPVGTLVPNGFYDREKAAWVPDPNGLVIQILAITNGLAQVDLTGNGTAADAISLATNQFTSAELQQLAASYVPGNTLWRVPLTHFTAIDWNFAIDLANHQSPNTPGDKPKTNPCDTCPDNYGTVNLTSQIFEEAIPMVGVPMALHYSSARVPGYLALAKAVIPVVGASGPPTNLSKIELSAEIAGVVTALPGDLNPNSTATVTWDGYDAYGRYLGGSRDINVEVDYFYPVFYGLPLINDNRVPVFANYGQVVSGSGHYGGYRVEGAFFKRTFTIPDHRTLGLGGWSLTPHHLYDPQQHFLYLGDGRILKPDRLGNGVGPLPGLDSFVGSSFYGVLHVAAAPDGTLFFEGYFPYQRFFKRSPAGQYSFMTGNAGMPGGIDPNTAGGWGLADGKPITSVVGDGNYLGDMQAGPDGSLYLRNYNSIVRIDPQGIVHVVLGLGPNIYPTETNYPPDGSLARESYCRPGNPWGSVAIGNDGTVYYDDAWVLQGTNYNFIRKVAPDGRIYTLMGQAGPLLAGEDWRDQMGQTAQTARLNPVPVPGLAVGRDGSVFVSVSTGYPFSGGIFKITPGGLVEPMLSTIPFSSIYGRNGDEGQVAASMTNGYFAGGTPATSLTVAPDGSLLFEVTVTGPVSESTIWRVDPNGILGRLAGEYYQYIGTAPKTVLDGGNPLETLFPPINQFAVGPDNSLTVVRTLAYTSATSVEYIGPSLSGFTAQELQIPAEDASEIFVFDAHGNHLRTLNGLTGTTNWLFSYDANNLVTDIKDANGLLTHVERSTAGQPTGIVGPYGQRTSLALDANGFLSQVVNPASEATVLTNTKGGLLSSITGPRNFTYSMAYDADGLVTNAADPDGGATTFSHTDSGIGVSVLSVSSLSNTNRRDMTLLANGDTWLAGYFPDGTFQESTLMQGGAQSTGKSDGSLANLDFASDPRFPKDTRLLSYETVQLGGGPTASLTVSRSTTLSDPTTSFPVAVISNQMTLNGNVYTATYNGTNGVATLATPEARQQAFELDMQGRLIHTQVPGRASVDIVYDALGRVTEADNTSSVGMRPTTFSYDAVGHLSALVDPLNQSNQFSYNAAGRLQQLTLADGRVANFQIDSEFNLTSVTPPGRPAHHFDYDAVGQVTNYTPPVVNGLNESVGYHYDADRHLAQISLPDGQNIVFNRGLGGRIDQLVLGSGPTLTYQYADGPPYRFGVPTNIVSSTGDSLSFQFQGPLPVKAAWSGSITGRVELTLNTDFLRASETVNGSMPIGFTYDRDRLPTQVGDLVISRGPSNGFVTATTLGMVTDARNFDDRGLLTNYSATLNSTSIWSLTFTYDLLDRLTNKTEVIGGMSSTFRYVYDLGGRLSEVWKNGSLATTYTYDPNGNRVSRNAEVATYDAQDRLTSYGGASYGWSPNGTLNTRNAAAGATSYTYDVRGTLTSVGLSGGLQIDYIVDALGHRIGKKVGGTLRQGWLWSGTVPVAELDANSQVSARFIFASQPNVPDYMIKGTDAFRILTDERGSVRLVIKVADGTIAQQLDYDEFGRVLADTAPGFQPFGFAGGLSDPDTGLVRFGHRDYDPQIGRWTARDPLSFAGGALSLYAYVGNDPVNFVDPMGTGPWYKGTKGVLSIVGGVLSTFAAGGIILTASGPVAAAAAIYLTVNGLYSLTTGAINLSTATTPGSIPDSLPSLAAYAYDPNSNTAQNLAAVADLAGSLGIGRVAPNALQFVGRAGLLNGANDFIGANDKVASAAGLTPGSKPPGCP